MFRCSAFYLLIYLVCLSCTTAKKVDTNQTDQLPAPGSIKAADLFFLTPEKQFLYYQNADRILPTNKIEAGDKKYALIEGLQNFSRFSFVYKDTMRTLDQFIKATNVVGLIIIRNDTILLEHYSEGIGPETKWINFSIAKSVTSLLYGAALQDGYISTLNQSVTRYITELAGSVYDSVSLRDLLQMSSGVKWDDDPRDPESDLMKMGRLEKEAGWAGAIDYLSRLSRDAPAGTKFNYNTVETHLAGIALSRATGKTLSLYLSERIWKPFGMHSAANWVKSLNTKVEHGGCCISATLRDYALLGLFALKNGINPEGKSLLPKDWMQESLTPAKSYGGYGYYWWLHPNRRYFASGAFGQQVEVNPLQNTVIAIQSYWPVAFNDYYLGFIDGFIDAILTRVKSGE